MLKHRTLLPAILIALLPTAGCDAPNAEPKGEQVAAAPSAAASSAAAPAAAAAPSAESLPEVRYYMLSGG